MGEHKLQLGKEPRLQMISRGVDPCCVTMLFDRPLTMDEVSALRGFFKDINAVIEEHDRKRTPEENAAIPRGGTFQERA